MARGAAVRLEGGEAMTKQLFDAMMSVESIADFAAFSNGFSW